MDGDPTFIVLRPAAWIEASDTWQTSILGSVVRNFLSPTSDHVPSHPLKYKDRNEALVPQQITDFVLQNIDASSRSTDVDLKSIAGYRFASNGQTNINLMSKLVTIKRLQNHSRFWEKLRADKDVSRFIGPWVKKARETRPVCLVVGIAYFEQVEVIWDTTSIQRRKAEGGVSLGVIEAAAGLLNPLGCNIGAPAVRYSGDRRSGTIFRAKSGEAKIFAVEVMPILLNGLFRKVAILSDTPPAIDRSRQLGEDDDAEINVEDLKLVELYQEVLSSLDKNVI